MTHPLVPLRRLFKVINGGTPTPDSANWDGDVPWATPVDLGAAGRTIAGTERRLTAEGLATGSRLAPAGSILVSTRAPIGYLSICSVPMSFNQGCRALAPHPGVDSRFFAYQLMAQRDELQRAGQGSTFLELSSESLGAFHVAAPPRDEQQRIADFLDDQVATIDRALTLRSRQASLAREDIAAELDHQLDNMATRGTLPLRRLARYIEQGSSPQCENRPASEGEWGVLKLSAVRAGEFRASENKALPSGVEPIATYEIRNGDLLVTRANTPTLVGDVAVVRDAPRQLQLCDLIYRIHLTTGQSPDFVAAALLTLRNRSLVGAIARGTSSSMAKLRGEDVLNLRVPIASDREQANVAAMHVRSLDRKRRVGELLAKSSVLLQERKQAVITAAVTGQFDVTTARAVA
jgi:type I restriction enzyme S subunit